MVPRGEVGLIFADIGRRVGPAERGCLQRGAADGHGDDLRRAASAEALRPRSAGRSPPRPPREYRGEDPHPRTGQCLAARAMPDGWSSPTACSTCCIPATWACWSRPVRQGEGSGRRASTATRRCGDSRKGPAGRWCREAARARVLAALAAVDCVVLFDEDTPLGLIRALRARRAGQGRRLHPRARSSAPTSWKPRRPGRPGRARRRSTPPPRLVERLRGSS